MSSHISRTGNYIKRFWFRLFVYFDFRIWRVRAATYRYNTNRYVGLKLEIFQSQSQKHYLLTGRYFSRKNQQMNKWSPTRNCKCSQTRTFQ